MANKAQSKEKIEHTANGHTAVRTPAPPALEIMAEQGSEAGRHVSEAEYWEHYYDHPDFSYEWNNGILEVKPMSDPFQYSLYDWFVALLRAYLEVHPLAKRMALEMGIRLEAKDHVSIRKPDLFVVRHDNAIALGDHDFSYRGICDLCIESLSSSTKKAVERDLKTKKREYADVGVSEYFILDAHGVHTTFYRLDPAGEYAEIEPDADGVIRSTVLPGFQFRLSDLEHQPSLIQLAQDEVYRSFVLPEYQAAQTRAEQEHARAEQERVRAEQEHARAEQEHARADRLAAKLRELGIEADAE